MHVEHSPDRLHVEVEGPGVPTFSGQVDIGNAATLAWDGLVDAPRLPWPEPAGPPRSPIAEEWFLDPEGAARRLQERVDADVAADPDVAVNAAAPAGAPAEMPEEKLSVMDRLREAAADAARAGEPPFALIGAVQDAIRVHSTEQRETVRRELLETTERTLDLLHRFLNQEAGPVGD